MLVRPYVVLAFYFLLVSAGELATVLGVASFAVWGNGLALVLLCAHGALLMEGNHARLGRFLVALMPIPLVRIVSLTSPQMQFSFVVWMGLVGIILYGGIFSALRFLKPSRASVGLQLPDRRHLALEVGVVLAGFLFGAVEYLILRPGPIMVSPSFQDVVVMAVVLYVSTGVLEELLFRGLLQHYGAEALGAVPAMVLVTGLFAVLHAGWHSWLDIAFVAAVGGFYAWVVHRTRSILGVSLSHGITNCMLFIGMPLLWP
ncbi:MAG TPA: type II CAAX endopeptidase family protein [Candidatus Thermoplasmatota archaeon]|nr:type II CAAX endopeptidase family protein [Candidatus Thermoplasmatota archaeon]